MTGSLLDAVRGLLERTYRMRSGLAELAPFIIGDLGYRTLYGEPGEERDVAGASASAGGARTLIRQHEHGVAACIYFPDALIRRLESHPPQHGLGEENLDGFATFVEEVDHLLVIAERSLSRRPVSLFELELHANVSKYLVLARFLAGRSGRLAPGRRLWLRRRLFETDRFCDDDPAVRRRYRDARRWGVRLLDRLSAVDAARRVVALRRFHVAALAEKLRLIGAS